MKTMITTVNKNDCKIDQAHFDDPSTSLFIDIETTGLSPEYSYIYLIGVAYCNNTNDDIEIKQWLISNPSEEKEMLESVTGFISSYETVIHFNGNNFDLPFITARCKANGIDFSFENMAGIDIFRRVSSLKHFLKLDSCKKLRVLADKTSLEIFLGGGENVLSTRFYPPTTAVTVTSRGLTCRAAELRAMEVDHLGK